MGSNHYFPLANRERAAYYTIGTYRRLITQVAPKLWGTSRYYSRRHEAIIFIILGILNVETS